jgi:hypothetical protein
MKFLEFFVTCHSLPSSGRCCDVRDVAFVVSRIRNGAPKLKRLEDVPTCGTAHGARYTGIRLRNNAKVKDRLWSSGQSSWLHNGIVLWFLWGTNWIYVCYVEESRPPLWASGQNSWLQIRRSGFDSRHYQIFWEAVALERGPLSLVSTIEELLGRKSSGSGLETEITSVEDPSRRPPGTLYPQKLALTSPTSGGRSVGIVHSRNKATELLTFLELNLHTFTHLRFTNKLTHF